MSKEQQFSNLFIELDCLLDTRIATLYSMGEDVLKEALSEDYHKRIMDKFPKINNEDYLNRYNNRDKTILANGIITQMPILINDFVKKTHIQNSNTPFHYKPKITLNIYPYQLLDKETMNLITILKNITEELSDIEIVSMKYEEITPQYLLNNVSIIIMYEYYKWLEINTENGLLKKKSCPDVTLLGPAIYFKNPEKIDNETNPFEAMETLTAPFINLKLLPIKYFSSVRFLNK